MVFLAVVLALVSLLVAALCVPLDLAVEGPIGGKTAPRMKFVWLFGLVKIDLARKYREKPARVVVAKIAKKRVSPIKGIRRLKMFLELAGTRGLARQIARLLRRLVGTVRFKEIAIDLKLGLGDPADTGFLFALIGPLTPLVEIYSPYPLTIAPALGDTPMIEGYLAGKARVQPIRIVPPIAGFIFSPPVFRVLRVFIKRRWKGRG